MICKSPDYPYHTDKINNFSVEIITPKQMIN